jgi:hypothetical protein
MPRAPQARASTSTDTGSAPGRCNTGSSVTTPSTISGSPNMSCSSSRCSGATSTTNRPVDSENQAVTRSSWPTWSIRAPRRPPMVISARATARPPSLQSWHDTTSPDRIARCRRRYRSGAAGSRAGTGPPARPAPATGAPRAPGRGGCPPARCGSGPRSTSRFPWAARSGVTTESTSGTWATAVITRVGGTEWRSPSAPRYSLFRLSLPDTNGARWPQSARAAAVDRGHQFRRRCSAVGGRPS